MDGYFTINQGEDGALIRRRLVRGDVRDGVVVSAEPVVIWSMGKSVAELEDYCRSRNWKLEVHYSI